jgi:hypothetical protein
VLPIAPATMGCLPNPVDAVAEKPVSAMANSPLAFCVRTYLIRKRSQIASRIVGRDDASAGPELPSASPTFFALRFRTASYLLALPLSEEAVDEALGISPSPGTRSARSAGRPGVFLFACDSRLYGINAGHYRVAVSPRRIDFNNGDRHDILGLPSHAVRTVSGVRGIASECADRRNWVDSCTGGAEMKRCKFSRSKPRLGVSLPRS